MSPALGAQGFSDWQRDTPWDGPLLYSLTAGQNGFIQTSLFFVGRFQTLQGSLTVGTNDVLLDFQWWSSNSGGVLLGERRMVLNATAGGTAQICIPNLGPWVKILFTPNGAVNWAPTIYLFGSNRQRPSVFLPNQNLLESVDPTVLTAPAGVNTYFPAEYYDGPVFVNLIGGANLWQFQVFVETAATIFQRTFFANVPAGTVVNYQLIVPATFWKITLTNTGGVNDQMYMFISTTETGST